MPSRSRAVFGARPDACADAHETAARGRHVLGFKAVALPDEVATEVRDQLEAYCASRTPSATAGQLWIEFELRHEDAVIYERRAWHPDGTEWSSVKVARLRYDDDEQRWSLYATDSSGRWFAFDLAEPTPHVSVLLAVVDADPTGHFWG